MSRNEPPVFSAEEIVPRLVAEFGYSLSHAERIAHDLSVAQPRTKAAFWHWWNTGLDLPLEIEGYTKARLMSEWSTNPIAAFLNLDYLERDPDEAKAALEEGYDTIE